jgi:hypothetical protein
MGCAGEEKEGEEKGTQRGVPSSSPRNFVRRHGMIVRSSRTSYTQNNPRPCTVAHEQHPQLLHQSLVAFLLGADGLVNFFRMGGGELRGGLQVDGGQSLDGPHDFGIGHAQTAVRDQPQTVIRVSRTHASPPQRSAFLEIELAVTAIEATLR